MKITTTPKQPTFRPFNIVFTCETEEDAARLFAVFNYSNNTEALGTQAMETVRKHIKNALGHTPDYMPFHRAISAARP